MIRFLLVCLLPLALQAQEIVRWKGLVTSSKNSEAVSFATIAVYPSFKVFTADELGQVEIAYRTTDTLKVSCLGYLTKSILGKDLRYLSEMSLQPVIYQLDEVKISNKIRSEWWGSRGKRTNVSLTLSPGGKLAVFIPNHELSSGRINKVRYFLASFMSDGYRVPFRVQLYKVGRKGQPADPMINDVLMVQSEKRRWFEVDISQYQVALPPEGFFVGIEFLSNDEYEYKTEPIRVDKSKKKATRITKVAIGMGKDENNQQQAWMNFGKTWSAHNHDNSIMKNRSAMMGAEIEF